MASSIKKGITNGYVERRMRLREIKEKHKYPTNYIDNTYGYDLKEAHSQYSKYKRESIGRSGLTRGDL